MDDHEELMVRPYRHRPSVSKIRHNQGAISTMAIGLKSLYFYISISAGHTRSSQVHWTHQRDTYCLMVRYSHLCCRQSDTKYLSYRCWLCCLQSRVLYRQLPSFILAAGICSTMFEIGQAASCSTPGDTYLPREIITLLPLTQRQLHWSYESCASLSQGFAAADRVVIVVPAD